MIRTLDASTIHNILDKVTSLDLRIFLHRAKMNSLACQGKWDSMLEDDFKL